MYKELEVSLFSMEARLNNLLYFPFWFAIDNVRWGSLVIGTVGFGFSITSQEVDVEDRVDLHGWGKGQAISYGGQFPIDEEWSISAWR